MQYNVLIYMFFLILIIILYKNIYCIIYKTEWKKSRKKVNIYNIFLAASIEVDYEIFCVIWIDIADSLDIDAEIIRPNDSLLELTKLYPFQEILFDNIEDLFIKYDVNFKEINNFGKHSNLLDIVNILASAR